MRPSSGGDNNNNSNRVSCTSSKSSSTCSSPSLFTSSAARKSMEEVWKDINLASLHDHPANTTTTTTTRGMIFQDFLARSSNKDPPTSGSSTGGVSFLGSGPPATVLSLNSGPNFNYLESCSDPIRPNPLSHSHATADASSSFLSSLSSPFDALASSSVFPSFCKGRPPEDDDHPSERRHKRMIKNRESAARSRARRQAYTNELELEIAHLMEENAKLRRQQEKLCFTAPAQLPKKHTLYRTSTAPF